MNGIISSPIFRLSMTGLVCGLMLTLFYQLTADTITDNKARHAEQKLSSLLPDQTYQVRTLTPTTHEIWQNDELVGHIMAISTDQGYNGEINLWLAVTTQRGIISARVIDHHETPGIGDKFDIEISNWILSFEGANLTNRTFKVKKDGGDFDQFTGATITPRAIIQVIEQALISYPGQIEPTVENRPKDAG